MESVLEEVRLRAEKYFNEEYNCAQAVALSNIEVFGVKTGCIKQIASGFGHGMNAGCTCGAIAGGVLVIGLLLANTDVKGFDKTISEVTAELHKRFIDEFGITCCRGLRKKLSPFKNAHCRKITITTAALTLELLLAKRELPAFGVHVL